FFSPQNSGQAKKLPWPAASPSAGASSSPAGAAKTPKSLKFASASAQSASSAKKQKSISKTPKRKDKTDKQQQVPGRPAEGDLVWARLDPYPWWPALVCRHPTRRRTFEANRRPDRPGRVHVQFLDSPPNRSWVPADCVQLWTDLAGGNCEQARSMMSCGESMEPEDPKLAAAYKMALDAQPLSRSDRLDKLLAQQEPSCGEEDNAGPNGTSIDDDADEAVSTVRKRGREESPDANSGLHRNYQLERSAARLLLNRTTMKNRRLSRIWIREKVGLHRLRNLQKKKKTMLQKKIQPTAVPILAATWRMSARHPGVAKLAAADKKKQKNPTTLADTSIASTTKTTPARKPGSGLSRLAAFSPASVASSDGEASFSASALDRSTLASAGAADDDDVQLGGGQQQIWDHLKLDWLRPERIRDSAGRRPDNPEYDGRTLLVPERYYTQVTPAMRQWWELKSRHFDTVLFFKVGKFYELYHMDAVLGVQELNLSYMRGAYAHSGFPEVSFGRMADSLVQKGYKVARVEQTETPDQMQERTRGRPGKEKVMRREICRVTTPGTRLASHWDGDALVTKAQYLLAVKEAVQCNAGSADSDSTQQQVSLQFGVAFVDTTIGQVWVGQFADDCHCSRLRTLIAHHPPAQLLHERGRLRPATLAILNGCLRAVPKEALTPGREFWDSGRCLAHLAEAPYFVDNGKFAWPEGLQPLLCESDSLGRTAARQWELGVSALGGLVHYLSRCLIDHDVLSMRNFAVYRPADSGSAADEAGADEAEMKAADAPPFYASQTHAVLDGIALANLDVFAEQQRGGGGSSEATLYSRLDRCGTAFGKRLLQQWLCAPLCHPEAIQRRQEAVAELVSADRQVCQELSAGLKKLPDLEKLTAKMHVFGCRPAGTDHPDQRAVLFEAVQYNKRKIEDFLGLLAGFEAACRLMAGLAERKLFDSELLRQLINPTESGGRFPSLLPTVRGLRGSFDNERAKREGVIIPERGVLGEYDEAVSGLTDCEQRAKAFLAEQGGRLGCKLNFVGSGRTRYQVGLLAALSGTVLEFELDVS
uniref:PWWP domain-containing protein n=1 Tax=Macrostomum lignano TaxID=282301 RepID=A0A1I8IXR1_9PLAT